LSSEESEDGRKDIVMPGKKYRSIKKPKMYEGLRKKGFSKSSAAKISNAKSKKKKK
jgi:hypothetical protein